MVLGERRKGEQRNFNVALSLSACQRKAITITVLLSLLFVCVCVCVYLWVSVGLHFSTQGFGMLNVQRQDCTLLGIW